MNWKEAMQQASHGGGLAFRVEETVEHMAAIWPKDGTVFIGDENPSTACCIRTRIRSERQVEWLLEEFAVSRDRLGCASSPARSGVKRAAVHLPHSRADAA